MHAFQGYVFNVELLAQWHYMKMQMHWELVCVLFIYELMVQCWMLMLKARQEDFTLYFIYQISIQKVIIGNGSLYACDAPK